MVKNPAIYEINTRVWIRQFDKDKKRAKLTDIPGDYWDDLKSKGMHYVWLMGIWKTNEEAVQKYCFEDFLIREYTHALKDFRKSDVIGSPYAIEDYIVNPELGNFKSLLTLKRELNKRGMKLILDFIPNHFSAESPLINSNPEVFLDANEEYYEDDPHTFYKPSDNSTRIFAHGRDPFFPAWQDTIQVNYFNKKAREFMIMVLVKLTKLCDGVRCDMAMLSLNNIFKNTWGGTLSNMGYTKPEEEFWKQAITIVKDVKKDFLFIAEAYWDLEYQMQQQGFDYTYDKKLTDRIEQGYPPEIRDHLLAEYSYQHKSVRFIENHDEERSVTKYGKYKAKAAAVLISTLQGMRFYNDGQFEGKRVKLPVQLGREPEDKGTRCMPAFYEKLLSITNQEIFLNGDWTLLKLKEAWDGNQSFRNIIAYQWEHKDDRKLVAINFSMQKAQCRVLLDMRGYPEQVIMRDLLNDKSYVQNSQELAYQGLYIDLQPFSSHIFEY